ncbi:opioid-binding protein/cell adhesion molecule-like [Saccostrea cucullata]|uniref:opioid-binding protein/cell adhesion molecule-like n=1 Tax=Saccostrea cuccullata TaxID=36930 RepID=UPI002ED10A5F
MRTPFWAPDQTSGIFEVVFRRMNLEKTIIGIISISAIKCMILNPSPFANIRYGGQLVLTCEADNEWDSISWRRASDVSYTFVFRKADCETKDNGEGKRAICSKSLNKTTIIFYDTTPKNNDTWECLAAYPGNGFESERTKVFISDPSIDISNETEVLYGEEADILCTLDPGWSRCTWRSVQNDEEIFSIISCRNMTATNYSLNCDINNVTLHVVTPIHQEVFECAGYYFIGEETHSPKGRTMIFIYAMPPRVHILPSTDPTEFFSFKLLCTAIGHPIPTVVWKYENVELSRSVGENAIVFTKLNRTDSGNYSCEGISSHLGTTLKNTTHYILTVQYPPIARINDLVVSCGDNVSIGCLVDEGIPTDYTLLKWEHRFNGTFIQKLNVSNRQFFISHMTLSDIGEYVCVVSNGVMDINRNMFIEGSGNLQASSCMLFILKIY